MSAPYEPPERLNIAAAFLDQRVREGRGDRVALRLPAGAMTYREVQLLAGRWGQVLRRLGARQEERIFLALPDGADFAGALFGALKLGCVVVMINPQLREEEIAHLFAYGRPSVAVVDAGALPAFAAAAGGGPWPRRFLVAGGEPGPHASFEGESRAADGRLDTVETHRDDPAIWLFSGGTTGRPKAVVQTHGSFANTAECYARRTVGYREDDVTLSVPKLFFGYATGSNLFFPFAVGATAVLFPERPTAEVLFEKIRAHRPTILVNVPTMVSQMVSHPAAREQDLSCLRFATSAGEALPPGLYHRWKETFGCELLDGLGTAEMWHIFLTNRPGDVRPGTLGRAVPGFELRVCDEEGRPLPDGEVGRLWVRGASRALGYWQALAKTAECFRGEWFAGGDLVRRDADGYITYCGRDDDVLKVGGKWLAPGEVESCLLQHPAVSECAVVGVANEDGLTKPHAFVVPARPEPGLEEVLRAFVLSRLEPYKHPRRVVLLEALPRTHRGKVDRARLRALAAGGPGAVAG